jgi:quercetin dioxygenase-like cupin family protein
MKAQPNGNHEGGVMKVAGARIVFAAIALSAMMSVSQVKPADGPSQVIVANPNEAKWESESHDSSGSQSATLREDPQTGGLEILVRYPAGFVFPPHWHSANERIILLEGRLSIHKETKDEFLDPGGYAFLPAKEVQKIACVSTTRCMFYIYWDGKLDFHKVTAN